MFIKKMCKKTEILKREILNVSRPLQAIWGWRGGGAASRSLPFIPEVCNIKQFMAEIAA
jgi:hypothetical protein